MPEDKGYEAGEEEGQKIEEIIARRRQEREPEFEGEPEESLEEDREDYEEDVELAERVKAPEPKRKLGTGEPIYLYIRTGIGTYTVVDRPFDSHIEARQYADENFKGTKYKTMSETDIKNYLEKLEKKREKIQQAKEKVVEGAKKIVKRDVKPRIKRYAQAGLEASYDVAQAQGMTRPQMEPRIRESWGVEERAPVKQPPPPEPKIRQPSKPVRRAPAYQPSRPPRMAFGAPPRPTGRINIPQQRRTRINIPPGGGVFRGPSRMPVRPRESPYARRRIKTKPAFKRTPIKPTPPKQPGPIRAGGLHKAELHMITPRGISTKRRQPNKKKRRK